MLASLHLKFSIKILSCEICTSNISQYLLIFLVKDQLLFLRNVIDLD